MSYRLYFWALFVISAVLFFAPLTVEERLGLGLDKLAHFGLFFILHYFVVKCYPKQHPYLFWYLAAYAVGVEFIQGEFLPYRSFDVLDMVFGFGGLVVSHIYDTWSQKNGVI